MKDVPVCDKHGRTLRGLVGRFYGGNVCTNCILNGGCWEFMVKFNLQHCNTLPAGCSFVCSDSTLEARFTKYAACRLRINNLRHEMYDMRTKLCREVR